MSVLCTIDLSIIYSDSSTLDFKVRHSTLIRSIIRSCKERNAIKGDLSLYHGNNILKENKTVSQSNLQNGDQLIAKIISEESLLLDYVHITIKHDESELHYRIPRKNTLNSLILDYNEKYESNRSLWFGSYQISGTETIDDLGLENDDILIAK